MTEDKYIQQRNDLIDSLEYKGIRDSSVLTAMRKVPRHVFIDSGFFVDPYEDSPQKIGCAQTISQPYIVALMTEHLQLKGDEVVLELGTGCGYQTAVLCELVKQVYTIERIETLFKKASKNLTKLGYSNCITTQGDGSAGWKEKAPYDAIIVTAQAPEVPAPLLNQLAEGGRLVIPVGKSSPQTLLKLTKEEGKFVESTICGVYFVPLIGQYAWPEG